MIGRLKSVPGVRLCVTGVDGFGQFPSLTACEAVFDRKRSCPGCKLQGGDGVGAKEKLNNYSLRTQTKRTAEPQRYFYPDINYHLLNWLLAPNLE